MLYSPKESSKPDTSLCANSLRDVDISDDTHAQHTQLLLKRTVKATIISFFLLLATLATRSNFRLWSSRYGLHRNAQFVGAELRSNGTHDFKRTVLMVSIDGLR